jgi:hypothetical protein
MHEPRRRRRRRRRRPVCLSRQQRRGRRRPGRRGAARWWCRAPARVKLCILCVKSHRKHFCPHNTGIAPTNPDQWAGPGLSFVLSCLFDFASYCWRAPCSEGSGKIFQPTILLRGSPPVCPTCAYSYSRAAKWPSLNSHCNSDVVEPRAVPGICVGRFAVIEHIFESVLSAKIHRIPLVDISILVFWYFSEFE